MGNKFAVSEVVELGIQIEINGRDFYGQVLKISKNPNAKEVFSFLKSEEENHIKIFKKILDSLASYEPKEAYPDEYFSYMNSLANGYVFTQKVKGIEIGKTIKDEGVAIDLGINFEKDSIAFYEGMKKLTQGDNNSIIETLISEEKSHLEKLKKLKSLFNEKEP